MAGLRVAGTWLERSGWEAAVSQAEITPPGTASAFVTASHVARTRHAHQVTATALYTLQHRACDEYAASEMETTYTLKTGAREESMNVHSLLTGHMS